MPSSADARPVLHHITFKTTRLQPMIEWYGAVVGMRVNFQDAVGAWMSNDSANHRIALLAIPGLIDDPEKRRRTGMHHSAFEYETFDALMENYARLRGRGIAPAFCLDHGVTISLYYNDPDGNVVELQVDNFADWERSAAWMRTAPEFKANPIGVFFDPELAYRAHKSGKSFAEVRRQTFSGEFQPNPLPDLGIG
ncbi:MAG TPA: VOC family protein [Xanthobacteraceae bacterium]|nr:VOC family protein [Xanthobacteraceae bacterium]